MTELVGTIGVSRWKFIFSCISIVLECWKGISWHTGPTTLIHKNNSKEAISMWPDMHSFYLIHTFEPLDFLSFSLRKVDPVLRFTKFTVSNCSTFYLIHKFGPILARICELSKTSNQKLITWVISKRLFEEKMRESLLVRKCELGKTNAYQVTWKSPLSNWFCELGL